MSTSMHYISRIEVRAAHVARMRDVGPASLLVWNEASGRVQVQLPTGHLDELTMIIAPGRGLDTLTETREDNDEPRDDFALAEDLTDIANDWLTEWALVKAMTPTLAPIRHSLDQRGVYPAGPVHTYGGDGSVPTITDTYARPDGKAQVQVTVPLGYAEPVRLRTHVLPEYTTVSDYGLAFDAATVPSAMITATLTAMVTAHLDVYDHLNG
ncbi:hypothetical protein AB0I72_28020 [Nocardiopsis sp. NPDC049922]|uniref:hypothetical protein n=1 Tax=Nocardiopsis sp. NPDC049922 TaxID=3155157 RepID=UPI003411C475